MTQIWMDGFDHYGDDSSALLDGVWAELDTFLGVINFVPPGVGARTGARCLSISSSAGAPSTVTIARRVLGATHDELFISMGIYLEGLPVNDTKFSPIQMRDVSNNILQTLTVGSDGRLIFRDGDHTDAVLAQTSGPVLVSGTWHHLEVRLVRHASAGIIEVRVDEVEVLNTTGLALGAVSFAQFVVSSGGGGDADGYFIDDLIIRDAAGTRNNGFEGDLRVATLQPIANGVNQGWAKRPIVKLDVGVLEVQDSVRNEAVAFADNAALEIGANDFCVETFVRFNSVPGGTEEHTILSKWRESTDDRSWRLLVNGPTLGGNIVFETSVLGTSGDNIEVHAFPFIPIKNRWYHVAVTRSGTSSRLFIDGVQVGVTQTDSRTYFNGIAKLFVNALQDGVSTVVDDSGVDGWFDGTRITITEARYTSNFAPPSAALPADLGGDALYDEVELLLNYDVATNPDQSANAFSDELLGGAAILFPDDEIAFENIHGFVPNDFDFVEADLVAALGTLTFGANPLNTETVTLGGTTYTFLTILVDTADNVLIGADAAESMDNLKAAVNLEAGVGTLYGTGTVLNADAAMSDLPGAQGLATAKTAGAAGNSITSTETVTGGSWAAATLEGGSDIPANSEFVISAMPPDTTRIKSVAIVGRNFKTDGGSSEMQMSFVEAGGSSLAGATRPVTLTPTYYEDTFETDPSTAGDITPSTLVGARIRLNRTT